jgi:predicted MFS family arabinose efflux permease
MTTSPPPDLESPERDLWRHADFLRLWGAQVVSAFGSRITRTALPIIAVTTLQQSESVIGVLAAMQLIPGVILAMVAGGFVDRGRKRRILIASDLIRAGLVASLTVAWVVGALTMVHVVLVGAGVGAASALFQIADGAYLPSLIGRRKLVEGNAKLETTEAVAEITGPASAGVLIAALGAPLVVVIDAASYVWSALLLGRIRAVERPVAKRAPIVEAGAAGAAGADELPVRTGEDFRIGMRAVFGHPQVRPIVLTLMAWSVAGGFFVALYTVFCLRELGVSEAAFGVIIAMGGIGSLAGAVLARGLARSLGVGRTLVLTSALSLACTLFIPLAATTSSHTVAIGLLVAHQLLSDGFAVAFLVLAVTLRQTVLPRELLGRANAAIHVCTTGVLPLAALLAGGLAELIGIQAAVWVGLVVGLVAPVFVWRLRHVHDMPTGDLGASDSGLARVEPHA